MRKKAYLRTIEVAIAIILTFAIAYFIIPRASVTVEDNKLYVLPTLEQKQEFRDCVMQMNYLCVEGYLRDFIPQNYDFAFDITDDPNTPHQGLPDKGILAESIYISGTNNPSAINREGLILAYNFDINESNFTKDLSDFGSDGSLYAPHWIADGYYGGSYYFEGSGHSYIAHAAYPDRFKLNFPFTMMAWIKKSNDGLILTIDYSNNMFGASLYTENDQLVAKFGDGYAGNFNKKKGTTVLQNGVWYSVAAVIKGNNDIDLYVNGANDGGFYSGFATSIGYSAGGIYIGQSSSGPYYKGQIGPVRVYKRVLSSSEISNMNVLPTEINLYNPKIIKVYYWRKG